MKINRSSLVRAVILMTISFSQLAHGDLYTFTSTAGFSTPKSTPNQILFSASLKAANTNTYNDLFSLSMKPKDTGTVLALLPGQAGFKDVTDLLTNGIKDDLSTFDGLSPGGPSAILGYREGDLLKLFRQVDLIGSQVAGYFLVVDKVNINPGIVSGRPGINADYQVRILTAAVPNDHDIHTIEVTASTTAHATIQGSNVDLLQNPDEANVQFSQSSGIDERLLLEFGLNKVPAKAEILYASIDLPVHALAPMSLDSLMPRLQGFVGDGTIDVSDVTANQSLISVSHPITETGSTRIFFDPSTLRSLVQNRDYLGIMVKGSSDGGGVQFLGDDLSQPILRVTYAVPEVRTDILIASVGILWVGNYYVSRFRQR